MDGDRRELASWGLHYPSTTLSGSSDEEADCGSYTLFAGWILTADIANATTYKDIAGQWCGDVTDYVFTPDTLTVKFHDNRPDNVFKITKYTYANDSVGIDWLNGDEKLFTIFAEFSGNKTTMAQQGNDDRPRRPFHRC